MRTLGLNIKNKRYKRPLKEENRGKKALLANIAQYKKYYVEKMEKYKETLHKMTVFFTPALQFLPILVKYPTVGYSFFSIVRTGIILSPRALALTLTLTPNPNPNP